MAETWRVTYLPPLRDPVRTIGRRRFDFSRQIVVMGIVNRTPIPSSTRAAPTRWIVPWPPRWLLARLMRIGSISVASHFTRHSGGHGGRRDRPRRAVVERVAAASDIVISVDTFRPEVASRCIAAGAAVINDTTGLHDPELADVVAGQGASVVITHSLALPRQHLRRPQYSDVVTEIKAFLAERVQLAVDHGVPESRIVIDPGHDLNKNTLHTPS